MFKLTLHALIVSIFSLANILSCLGQASITLYSEENCEGIFFILSGSDYNDLSMDGYDDMAKSANMEGGWIFYELKDFNFNSSEAGFEHFFSEGVRCQNLNATAGKLSSLLSIGYESEYSGHHDSLDLFAITGFRGTHEYTITTTRDSLGLDEHSSAILIGGSSWTIFSQEDRQGPAYCLFPDELSTPENPTFIEDFMQLDIPIPYNFIKSVEQGCLGLDLIPVRIPARK